MYPWGVVTLRRWQAVPAAMAGLTLIVAMLVVVLAALSVTQVQASDTIGGKTGDIAHSLSGHPDPSHSKFSITIKHSKSSKPVGTPVNGKPAPSVNLQGAGTTCYVLGDAGKWDATTMNVWTYTSCNGEVTTIFTQNHGQHCTTYFFGCWGWTSTWDGSFCQGGGTDLWCPGADQDYWNVPGGWLVQGGNQTCIVWLDQTFDCVTTWVAPIQF